MPETKKCSNCFAVKPLTEFYVKRGYGHQSRCKACNAEVCAVYKKAETWAKIWGVSTAEARTRIRARGA